MWQRKPAGARPRVLLFDYDGVIADSFEVAFGEYTAICTGMGFDKINSMDVFLRLFDGNLIQQLVKAGFPVWRLKQFAGQFSLRIAGANKRVAPFPGMPGLLTELAAAWPLYIITSNKTAAIMDFIAKYGVRGVRKVLGADVEPSKAKKIRSVMRAHRGCDAYYIGDTKGDIIEGRAARAITVAAAWGWHPEERLRAGKPDYLVRDREELRTLLLGAQAAAD